MTSAKKRWRVDVYVAELKQQIETLRKLRKDDELELVKLRAELAALRDAGDEEIDDLAREAGNAIGSDYYQNRKGCHEAEECLDRLRDIAKARGLKIAEQAKELDSIDGTFNRSVAERATSKLTAERDEAIAKLANETKLYIGANEAQKQREISACERAKIPYGGCDTVHDLADLIVVLIRERDEAIGLLEWIEAYFGLELSLNNAATISLDNLVRERAKRILELTAK